MELIMNLPAEFIPNKTVTLDKLKFALDLRIAKEEEASMPDILAYMIRGYVYAQDAGKKEIVKYPADWWQAFKERWLPGWLLKRFPVVYHVHEFQVKATYPDLAVMRHEPVLRLVKSEYTDDPRWLQNL